MKDDYYSVLGVEPDADRDKIQSIANQLVHRYHPDVCDHPDANEMMTQINKARDVLLDSDERSKYDQLGHAAYIAEKTSSRQRTTNANESSSTNSSQSTSSRSQSSQSQSSRSNQSDHNGTHTTPGDQKSYTTTKGRDFSQGFRNRDNLDDATSNPGWFQPSRDGMPFGRKLELIKYPLLIVYWAVGSVVGGLMFAVALLPLYLSYRRKKYADRILSKKASDKGFNKMLGRMTLGVVLVLGSLILYNLDIVGSIVSTVAMLVGFYLCIKYLQETLIRDWFRVEGSSRPVAWDVAARGPLLILPLILMSGDIGNFRLISGIEILDILLLAPSIVGASYIFTKRRAVRNSLPF
jgi:curved DNA-binding protein CbpA